MRLLGISLVFSLFFAILGGSCRGEKHDSRLEAISSEISVEPTQALHSLDSIDKGQLSAANRHYYDFLRIKASDKAYIYHTSDSLILDVISYYATHENALYPEVLYYGARVYSDLGDYPTAISYFQNALDQLPENDFDYDLKTRILSQMGRQLNEMGLYEEAIQYIKAGLGLEREINDTLSIVYDLQLLGSICNQWEMYEEAERYLSEAMDLGIKIDYDDQIVTIITLALVKNNINKVDEALFLIREAMQHNFNTVYNGTLRNAAKIYFKKGILDTAYLYADRLIHSDDPIHKYSGYRIILSPQLRNFVPSDSLDSYYTRYEQILDKEYSQNQTASVINQNSRYNYILHDRERAKAEKTKDNIKNWLIIAIIVILVLMIILLVKWNFSKITLIKLLLTYLGIMRFNRKKESVMSTADTVEAGPTEESLSESSELARLLSSYSVKPFPAKDIKEEIRQEVVSLLLSAPKTGKKSRKIPYSILNSKAYGQLREKMEREEIISDKNPLWGDIENTILIDSPYFRTALEVLTEGRININEFHTALLIKCGIDYNFIGILTGVSRTGVGSRRTSLGFKIFKKKVSMMEVDSIILNL